MSTDLVNQVETQENYDEYNKNNKLVNDISYSYYYNNNILNNNSLDANQVQENQNQNQTINTTNNNSNRKYNSQLTKIDENLDNTLNQSINNNNLINNNANTLNINSGRMASTLDIRMGERERKKMLLNNIQTQINLRKKTKLEELKKRQEEDAQYLKDMIIRYPFGRGGGGAPIRDKSGNLVTYRRNLISDLKYNQSPINVDDDYDEVWGKEKRIGRYYVNANESQNINNNNINNNINDENTIRPYSTNPQINTIKNNNLNLDNNQNNRYENNINNSTSLKQVYNLSTNNLLNNGHNINNYQNLSNSSNLLNYNSLLYKKILERKKKELELEKQLSDIEDEELADNYNNMNQINSINNLRSNNIITRNIISKKDYNINTQNDNNKDNENKYLNKNDYYDNHNFVPKGQIHPRLENSFLFTDEINKLKNEIKVDQNSLLDVIFEIKKDVKKATKERKKVIKDLESLKFQINQIKIENARKNEEEIENDNNYVKRFVNDNEYDEYIEKILKSKENDNDYYYIGNSFFENYEKELPNKSSIKKEKNIFNIKKTYIDENQLELDELIKKSDDILQNLKDNEKIENAHKRRPEDYFNTSDYFFHTYRLNHANDYEEYGDNYISNYLKKKYINNYNEHKDDDDYEVKIEKI